MVVRHVANVKFSKMESRNLKFGVDRILSSDISSTNNSLQDDYSQIISCSGCLSFLHRANRQCSLAEIRALYKNQAFYDHPLKPLTRASVSELNDRESGTGNRSKRKRSWSRAVFSNLQRKGLEKRFQLQKYITKPDRRQLAATLGLTDAQVKVWFQNRRMKWRHAKESSGQKLNPKKKSETLDSDSEVCACHNPDAETESDVDVQTNPE